MPSESQRRELSRHTKQLLLRVSPAVFEAITLLAGPGRRVELVSTWAEREARAAGLWDRAVEAAQK